MVPFLEVEFEALCWLEIVLVWMVDFCLDFDLLSSLPTDSFLTSNAGSLYLVPLELVEAAALCDR